MNKVLVLSIVALMAGCSAPSANAPAGLSPLPPMWYLERPAAYKTMRATGMDAEKDTLIAITCDRGKSLAVGVSFKVQLKEPMAERRLALAFDLEHPRDIEWPVIGNGKPWWSFAISSRWDGFRPLVITLEQAHELTLTVDSTAAHAPLLTRHVSLFGAKDAITQVLAACDWPTSH